MLVLDAPDDDARKPEHANAELTTAADVHVDNGVIFQLEEIGVWSESVEILTSDAGFRRAR